MSEFMQWSVLGNSGFPTQGANGVYERESRPQIGVRQETESSANRPNFS